MAAPTTKHYLITGAARGIGRGLSRLLLQKGHKVFLLDNDEEELRNTAALLSKTYESGKDFDHALCNLRSLQDISSAVQQASNLLEGRLDVLLNNAASKSEEISQSNPLTQM
jgi:NAD(P)-dependent dehydrogenase (short-subunit alcohol dehydrogenase family)